MPQKCCVSNCRGNYSKGPKVSVFSFPANEDQRLKWIKAINRENFTPTKNSRVCELHFAENEIARSVSAYDDKKRKWLTAPLAVPRLAKGAVPSRFPECLSTTSISPEDLEKVCELRFAENEIARSVSVYDDKKRKWFTTPLAFPRLAKGAVPSRFPECLSTTSISPEDLEKTNKATFSNDFEADVKIEIKEEPFWLEELTPTEIEYLSEEPSVATHLGESDKAVTLQKLLHFRISVFKD